MFSKVANVLEVTLEQSQERLVESAVGGSYLPLKVHVMAGWDPKVVESAGITREDPKKGTLYKLPIVSDLEVERSKIKRKETKKVTMRTRKKKAARTQKLASVLIYQIWAKENLGFQPIVPIK